MGKQPAIAAATREQIEARIGDTPAARVLGRRLVEFDLESATATVSFEADEHFLNSAGMVQGGFVAAMLDETVGPALFSTLGDDEWAPTTDLHAQFLAPVYPGPLLGRGRVVKRGRSIAYLAAELMRTDGTVLATAMATVNVRRREI